MQKIRPEEKECAYKKFFRTALPLPYVQEQHPNAIQIGPNKSQSYFLIGVR